MDTVPKLYAVVSDHGDADKATMIPAVYLEKWKAIEAAKSIARDTTGDVHVLESITVFRAPPVEVDEIEVV